MHSKLILFLCVILLSFSCKQNAEKGSDQETSQKEIQAIDSITIKIENVKNKIEENSSELDSLLEKI